MNAISAKVETAIARFGAAREAIGELLGREPTASRDRVEARMESARLAKKRLVDAILADRAEGGGS